MSLFADPSPKNGDTVGELWKKINQIVSEQNGNAHPAAPSDWKYNSIFKVAQILSGT